MHYYSRVGYPKSCYMPDDLEFGKMIECDGNIKYVSKLVKKCDNSRLAILEEGLGSWHIPAI